jgi:thiol-disulfide isomerase/thioredoxin
MRSILQLLSLLGIITATTHAQVIPINPSPSLNIGDPAPALWVRDWIKGTPVQQFEKGNVYVVEFWATWCKPCLAAMTHLSALAGEYKDRVTLIGVDIYEKKTTSTEKVKAFVDSMGHKWDYYHVAAEDSNLMETDWLDASDERRQGIPRSFVVNAEGRLAWIGYPKQLDEVLPKIVSNTWDIKQALAKRNSDRYLAALDDSLYYELQNYADDPYKPGDLGKPDSALLVIKEIIRNEPKLEYAPHIAYQTFSSLLKTDPHKAYEYGKVVLVTPTYEDPACDVIKGAVIWYSDK